MFTEIDMRVGQRILSSNPRFLSTTNDDFLFGCVLKVFNQQYALYGVSPTDILEYRELRLQRRKDEALVNFWLAAGLEHPSVGICDLDRAARIRAVMQDTSFIQGIKHLALRREKIKVLPPEIRYLVCLETLDLYGNQLKELPPEIGKLAKLEKIDLYGNQIGVLPREFENLRASLTWVDLTGNQILEIPAWVSAIHYVLPPPPASIPSLLNPPTRSKEK
jgi:hypothetical protein